ncbi:hypothetical protein [Actinomadura violacea]|uniref:Lipoprotein n=1 Tax=Actinomadura violacea TaxID=2819934 RepID=A0ABS3RIE2_9ACTN|nr:hypothetical protein [Actinomadura violacea]MBO2456499.1 hypothetical protein [Actinomadura violacea]
MMSRRLRVVAAAGVCLAVAVGCGGGGHDGLVAALKDGPLHGYGRSDKQLDCYASALTEYGDKSDVKAFVDGGGKDAAAYRRIRIKDREAFVKKADACLDLHQFANPYPTAAFGGG